MDLWIAVAAAGAGYAAKCWQNLSRDRESSSEFPSGDSKFVKPQSPPSTGHRCDKSYPIRRSEEKKIVCEDDLIGKEQATHNASTSDVASMSWLGRKKLFNFDNCDDRNVLSISSLSPVHLRNEDQVVEERLRENGSIESCGNSFREHCMTEMSTAYGLTRNKISFRSKQRNMRFIKPLNSLESCLMDKFYKEHGGMNEYVLNSGPLPSSTTARPFFVTDGRKIISRGSDSFSLLSETAESKPCKKTCSVGKESVLGVPPLPYVGSLELPRMKVQTEKGLGRKVSSSSKMINGKHSNSITGSPHGALLFSIGLAVGLIYSLLANRREADKLNDLLKQSENLVQDLQDELEMKDSLTVKELATEDYESQDACYFSYNRAPHPISSQQNLDGSTQYDGKELYVPKSGGDTESISKIEAELEAELERLELNISSSSLEGRLSDLVELGPDFIPDLSHGELRPDMFGRHAGVQPYADRDGSGISTPRSANYAVSPRELSLRLHEVIQSRLEERVKELETALENSQIKVQFMESDHKTFLKDFSNHDDLRSFFYQNTMDQPVVINLSGEALDAYNEAYDELLKMNESEEADLTSGDEKRTFSLSNQNVYPSQNGVRNRFQQHHTTTNCIGSPALIPNEVGMLDDQNLSGDNGFSGDEIDDDGHDEVEKLLIKQIVEKTRRGYSVILNAEKGLFSDDECEQ
ncbi:hypothetical protein U1Q18_027634 [Sarracenia purpurea var. burkii]